MRRAHKKSRDQRDPKSCRHRADTSMFCQSANGHPNVILANERLRRRKKRREKINKSTEKKKPTPCEIRRRPVNCEWEPMNENMKNVVAHALTATAKLRTRLKSATIFNIFLCTWCTRASECAERETKRIIRDLNARSHMWKVRTQTKFVVMSSTEWAKNEFNDLTVSRSLCRSAFYSYLHRALCTDIDLFGKRRYFRVRACVSVRHNNAKIRSFFFGFSSIFCHRRQWIENNFIFFEMKVKVIEWAASSLRISWFISL